MIKITDIQKQVIDTDNRKLKKIFKKVFDDKLAEDDRLGRKVWHDSDFEDIQEALRENGIDVTWKALYKFLDPNFDEKEWDW